jgi:hypothetical protein
MNPLKQLQDCGQSIWLDYIRRNLITSGECNALHCARCWWWILTAMPSRFSKSSKSRISRWPPMSCDQFTIKLRAQMASSASRSLLAWLMTLREVSRKRDVCGKL